MLSLITWQSREIIVFIVHTQVLNARCTRLTGLTFTACTQLHPEGTMGTLNYTTHTLFLSVSNWTNQWACHHVQNCGHKKDSDLVVTKTKNDLEASP